MPSDLYNWDRRDLRRLDGGGAAGGYRWRPRSFPHHHAGGYNSYHGGDFHRRWIPGHGKQGSRNFYLDEFGHGLMPSRPTEKMPEDGSCRPSGSGRYGRYNREYRGSSVQKDWRAYPAEIASQPNGSGKPKSTSDQRSVDVMPSHNSSTPSSDSINSQDQSLSKYQHENNDVGSLGSTGQKLERENSLSSINWKPLLWNRSDSLSVRNSEFGHSSSSKSLEPDSSDMKMELMPGNAISVLSPAGAATAAFAADTSNPAAEETNSRKKPRLGWGEGLAKYEKKKVESSDESEKNGATTYYNLEPSHSYPSNCSDKSPKLVKVPHCASPATPSSVACSSSPGMEEKQVIKTGSTDHDSAYICNSPSVTQLNADRSFNLGDLDLTTNSDLNSSIEELLKYDDPTVDSSFVRSIAMNKLLLLKNNISKAVETTETEIDLLENELKAMNSESGRSDNNLYASSSVPVVYLSKPYDHTAAPNAVLRLSELHVVVDSNVASKDDPLVLKDVDADTPGSATSKFVEVSLSKDAFPPKMSTEIEVIRDPGLNMSNLETEPEMGHLIEEKPITDGIGSQMVGCSSVSSDDDCLSFYGEDISHELMSASKRNCEQIASEMINKLLPSSGYHFDFSSVVKASCVQNDLVKERFLKKKYYYKLKEKILILKFKIFRHLWKEDMHIRSLKKLRGKTQKKFELSSRKSYRSYLKHRPSVRSRCSSTGISLLASTELLSYASRLLAEPQMKPLRCMLKMPSMIIDRQERMATRFISYNNLVEDPLAVEKERSKISKSWSEEEQELFIDKLAVFGKDFKKIAISLGHRTTAECVQFYYKNRKSDSFKRAKKKQEFSKHSTTTYMRTSGNRLNLEDDAISLKIWGAASAIASKIDDCVEIQPKHTKSLLASGRFKMESGGDNHIDRSSNLCLYNNEREAVAADVLAGICCSLSSEAMSSCITSSLDPGESYQDQKLQIMGPSTRRPLTPEVIQNVVETCSDESCGDMDPTDWTDEEKSLLIQAVSSYGKDFTMISRCVRTKTHDQCKVFFSKARKCLGLDKTCSGSENMITDDINRGRSDACFLEPGSVICNGKSGLRIDEAIAPVNLKLGHDPMNVSIASVKTDLHSAQGIVVGDTTHTLTSKNLLPDAQVMEDNFGQALNGNDGNRNNVVVVSNLDVVHGVGQANVENLPNLVETENNAELVFSGSLGNASRAEVIPDLDVADDVGQVNTKSLPKVLETETQSKHLHAACRTVDEAEPAVERCLCECNSTANGPEAKETSLRCTLHDEHPGVHLAAHNIMQPTLESGDDEKPLVLQQPGSALVDQGSIISTTEHGKFLYDDESVVPEKMKDDERMQSTCKVEQHPIAVSTIKEMSCDSSCKALIPEGSDVAQYSGRDFHLQRCHSRIAVSSDAELASAFHEGDPSEPPSGTQPYVDKLSTNGDVKLFGQILSKTSQHQANLGSESSSAKCSSSQQAVDGLSAHKKHGPDNIVGLDNFPPRKIGFREQNRLSDSTILLARYPTAFSNYVSPSSKTELPSLNEVAKSSECSLNGMSTFSNRDVSANNGSADLNMYRNQEMQSLSILAQMQRIKDLDVVPGMQQQSGSMVAINVVGRRGVIGGQFVGVSDPVAAIKMQYAKSEQQQFSGSGLAASIIREDDPWRGQGNVGR